MSLNEDYVDTEADGTPVLIVGKQTQAILDAVNDYNKRQATIAIDQVFDQHRGLKTLLAKQQSDFASSVCEIIKNGGTVEELDALLVSNNTTASQFVNDEEQRYTLLHFASRYNRLDVMQYAFDKKCDINALTGVGSNPLHYAYEASQEVIKFLLDNGCKPDAVNCYGSRADSHVGRNVVVPDTFIEAFKEAVTK